MDEYAGLPFPSNGGGTICRFLIGANGEFCHGGANVYVREFAENRRFDPKKDYLCPVPLEDGLFSVRKVTPIRAGNRAAELYGTPENRGL